MTEDNLSRAISHFIQSATLEDLCGMAQEGLEAYFKEHPKESIAFVMEWNPDDKTSEDNKCH
jgi:hypothetical protein